MYMDHHKVQNIQWRGKWISRADITGNDVIAGQIFEDMRRERWK